jgi:catechol 2,3-dioxygenase-like lactoylglutathione lyase family enzyme
MFVLQHVGITFPPGRADTIRAFYGDGLGMTEMPLPPEVAHLEWVWFATDHDGVELHFISSSLPPDPTRAHHFCLQVDDLAAVRTRLREIDAPVSEAGTRLAGRERIFTRDPVGNLVEILEMTAPTG